MTNGGQPGGNIRTAFLYNANRVSYDEASLNAVVDPVDQQNNPENPFFKSRLPLAATFGFMGQTIEVVNVHFASKGGSAPPQPALTPSPLSSVSQMLMLMAVWTSALSLFEIIIGRLGVPTGHCHLDLTCIL
jgi:predicted extracellular nuclease